MANQVLINKTTLSAIGDAIREKKGESEFLPTTIIQKTPNYKEDTESFSGTASAMTVEVNIPAEATGVKIRLLVKGLYNSTMYGSLDLYYGTSASSTQYDQYNPSSLTEYNLEYDNTIKYFKFEWSNRYNRSDTGFYAEIIPLGVQGEYNPETHYTPLEIKEQIKNNLLYNPNREITGVLSYFDIDGRLDWAISSINKFSEVSGAISMFENSQLKEIPPIDFAYTVYSNAVKTQNIFKNSQIKTAPILGNSGSFCFLDNFGMILREMPYIREFPENYLDFILYDKFNTGWYTEEGYAFYKCYSLRKVPKKIIQILNKLDNFRHSSTAGYSIYQAYGFCYCIDDIILSTPGIGSPLTGNIINGLGLCFRVKSIVFLPADDGSTPIAKLKSQVLDLTNSIGYCGNPDYDPLKLCTQYNSGITKDKLVSSDESYQRLKNDPDWFSGYDKTGAYSRYNHDSAVETINSLPDTSAYLATEGGTNTIKFIGAAGAKTDGGAINTLTAEEIAVATEKGWTVTLS